MSFYERHKPVILGAVLAIVLVSLILGLAYLATYGLPLSDRFSAMLLSLSTVAFVGVFIALMVAIAQFRKSMAKPLIKVAFNKKGEQQATLIYKDGKLTTDLPSLWLINKGNAVARYFQIDFIIPENIGKQSRYTHIARDDGKYIIPHTNDGKYTLFVNQYLDSGTRLSAAIDTKKCAEADEDSFEIKYRIYGDWAETQEGTLKVKINKQ